MERKSKIVATIGPASDSEEVLEELILNGLNVARLNFSHADHETHERTFELIRNLAEKHKRQVAVLQDLCGPKIRLGEMADGVRVEEGQEFRFVPDDIVGDATRANITYDGLYKEVKKGDRIRINDGIVGMVVLRVEGDEIVCKVTDPGKLKSRKGVNLPGVELSVPALTEKDADDLRFGLKLGVDYVALSFVRKVEDLQRARDVMDEAGRRRPLIVKVEKGEVLDNLDEIVKSADGIMVARGDLGVEVPLEDVPLIQKQLIERCMYFGRPVITATQMLESMVQYARPTRAEVNDVANAILDGTDAVMLSAETAAGAHPVRALKVMARIASRTERALDYLEIHQKIPIKGQSVEAVTLAACEIAEEVGARAILACSKTGRTVRAISRYRPRARILGVTADPKQARLFALSWGVTPVLVDLYRDTDELVHFAMRAALKCEGIESGDKVIIVAGVPLGSRTNMVMVRSL